MSSNLFKNLLAIKFICILIILSFQCTYAAKVYNESGGIIMMEAENTESSLILWIKGNISGSTGSGNIEFTGNTPEGLGSQRSPLQYKFKINTAGDYALFINGRRSDQFTEGRKDIANDAYVRVEGAYFVGAGGPPNIKYLKEDEKMFIGRGGYQDGSGSFDWRWGDKLDIDALSTQPNPIYKFKAGETYTLYISGRSSFFALDRILFVSKTASQTAAKALTVESSSFDDGNEVERYSYEALQHFTNINAGEVPFYKDDKRDALAIDASNTTYRDMYAKATAVFNGKSDIYDLSLTTLSESDGECSYRLLINGEPVGSYQNTRITTKDEYKPQKAVFKAINIQTNDTITVEANTHTNKIFPEENGTAWARGRWRSVSMSPAVYQGRIAVVADGNYRDSDDLIGTPVSLSILRSFGLEKQLVHYSHSCDLKKGSNDPGGEYREVEMQLSCDGTAQRWGGFEHLTFYNCMTQQTETINDLTTHINNSSEGDPLWIIEAGEPDIMWDAVNNCNPDKRKYILIVSHHPANDSGDKHNLSDVMALGIPSGNLHYIPDQNTLLKTPLSAWHWARDHADERIKWLWERGERAQSTAMDYPAIVGKFDCSDAGMVYYWATINEGGDQAPDVPKLKKLFLDYLDLVPSKVEFVKPILNDVFLPCTDVVVEAALKVNSDGIDSVSLFVNDILVSTITSAPFTWNASYDILKNIQPGKYNLKLVASDTASLKSEANLTIEVPAYAYFVSPNDGDIIETGEDINVEANLNIEASKIAGIELFINEALIGKLTESPYTWSNNSALLKNMGEGSYKLKLVVTNTTLETSETKITVNVESIQVQAPYKGTAIAIPGKIEAEDYDLGGEGLAYHDTDDINKSGEYRNDGVDLGMGENSPVIGNAIGGEWTEYTIDVKKAGNYNIDLKYSSGKPTGGATISVELPDEGKVLIPGFVVPKTSNWQTYQTISMGKVELSAGQHIIRFKIKVNGLNLDWFDINTNDNVGKNNLPTGQLQVFPNPCSSGIFTINTSVKWSVFNLSGHEIMEGQGKIINLSQFPNATYFLKTDTSFVKLLLMKS